MKAKEKHAMALGLFEAGHFHEPLVLFQELLAEEESCEVWNDWAALQHLVGKLEEAEAGFRAALSLEPADIQAAFNLGSLLWSQERHREALPFLQQAENSSKLLERAHARRLLQQFSSECGSGEDAAHLEQFLRQFLSFDANEHSYFQTHVRRYVETLLLLPQGGPSLRLLELGAAFHHITPALKFCKGYGEIRCTDIWTGEPTEIRQLSSVDGSIQFSCPVDNFDLQSQPWPYGDASVDVVLCCEILEHLHTDPMGVLAEINRILKPGGLLLLSTPNLASAHAVEETMRGGSPYGYGKFELGGKPTDRHNREYTANEVERLAMAAGFSSVQIRTQDFYWPGKRETLRSLAVQGLPISRRGDCTFLLARKNSDVVDRYPEELYARVGVQAERRNAQSPVSTETPASPLALQSPRNILLVHELIPHHDCSGADLRLHELMRELRAQGHNVTLIARDNRDEERYRPALETMGVTVFAGDFECLRYIGNEYPPVWDLSGVLAKGKFDIAILSHWFWSGIAVPEHYLDEIRKHAPETRILVLSEDRHGERERRSAQLTGFLSDHERGNDFEQREVEIYERADLVLYVTETDQKRFLELLPELATEHLPTIAESPAEAPPGFAERDGVLFLGNFENLANRDALAWLLDNVWLRIHKEEPRLRLTIAGFAAPQGLEERYPGVVCIGKVDEMGPLFARHRIFAAPIRYGTGIITKNMHALAHGLPVVTTTVGAEGMQLQNEIHAMLADSGEAFSQAVLRLYRDETLWNQIATSGRQYIRAKFSLEHLQSQIRKIVSRAAQLTPRKFEPDHCWSYREVESVFPEVLAQQPAHYRPMLRTLSYWQLGKCYLKAANPLQALQQFRHIFAFVRGRLPASVFHSALLNDMAHCYRELGDETSARRCENEKQHQVWTWDTKAPRQLPGNPRDSAMNERMPEISIVFPTYNRQAILRLSLAALAFQSLPASRWEAVVVDDGSTDGTPDFFRTIEVPFRLHTVRQNNQGAGAARRVGVTAARGEYLLLCNDDTIASSNLLVEHLAAQHAHRHEKRAVLGDFRSSQDVVRSALSLFVNTSEFFFPQKNLQKGQLCEQAHFVTCNLSIRRAALLDAGNFDPAFRVAEDTELGTRLVQRGFRVVYHPEALAWHEHAQFTTRDLLRRAQSYGAADWQLFKKHPHLLAAGASPFGLLSASDELRIRQQVEQYAEAVSDGVVALEALDNVDFRLLFRDSKEEHNAPQDLMQQVAKLVPMIYWHFLFKQFLECWRASRQAQPTPELATISSKQSVTPVLT